MPAAAFLEHGEAQNCAGSAPRRGVSRFPRDAALLVAVYHAAAPANHHPLRYNYSAARKSDIGMRQNRGRRALQGVEPTR